MYVNQAKPKMKGLGVCGALLWWLIANTNRKLCLGSAPLMLFTNKRNPILLHGNADQEPLDEPCIRAQV